MTALSLQAELLAALQEGGAECQQLARRFGVTWDEADLALQALALRDLVDAHEPPPPCGRREMRWFVLPAGRRLAEAPEPVQTFLLEGREAMLRFFLPAARAEVARG